MPPDTLLYGGAYTTGQVLGQDDSGITYEGTDINLNRPVAIKEFFPPGYTRMGSHVLRDFASTTALERFLEEAQALARSPHPHSVKMLAVFEENNTAYMVTELLPGKKLEQEAEEAKPLPEIEALSSPEQISEAVVPEVGFVPLDIQPAVAVETQSDAAPVPVPVELSPPLSRPAPPSDWLPVPAKSRRCPRCGSVSPKNATHCVACNTSLTPKSAPETRGMLRTVHYVLLIIFCVFFVLLALYLPGVSPDG